MLANDTDAEGDTLSVSQVAGSAANVGVVVAGSDGGLFTIGSDGAWTFDPNSEFDSLTGDQTATTSITYHLSDGMDENEGVLTVTVSAPPNGITFVGSAALGSIVLGNVTIPLPVGIAPGDIVVVAVGRTATVGTFKVVTSGYTQVTHLTADDGADARLLVSYKIMSDPPDTDVVVSGPYTTNRGHGCVLHVWRGVDQTTPIDVTPTTATGINTGIANPPAITPVTDGAVVLCAAYAAIDYPVTPSWGVPVGWENGVTWSQYASAEPGEAGMASLPWSGSGAVDPGTFVNGNTDTGNSWAAVTLALRPAQE